MLAIGCGAPYGEVSDWSPYLTKVFLRHKEYVERFRGAIVVPDLAFIALPLPFPKYDFELLGTKLMGVCCARPIIQGSNYKNTVLLLAKALDYVVEHEDVKIRMLAFSTNKRASWENDILMNHEVYTHMVHKEAVLDYDAVLDSAQMDDAFSTLDYAFCLRFHSHVYAVRHSVPFISLQNIPKVEFLLKDVSMSQVAIKNLTFEEFLQKWCWLKENEARLRITLRRYAEDAYEKKSTVEQMIKDAVGQVGTDGNVTDI